MSRLKKNVQNANQNKGMRRREKNHKERRKTESGDRLLEEEGPIVSAMLTSSVRWRSSHIQKWRRTKRRDKEKPSNNNNYNDNNNNNNNYMQTYKQEVVTEPQQDSFKLVQLINRREGQRLTSFII